MSLAQIWFVIVVLCWVLFLVLEGFDFGVGILAPLLGRDDHERGAVIATVGPFWDGNEVWLVAAIGVTFAAFPSWYAAMLSGLYLPMVLLLLLLAGRGVALEFRGKGEGERWRRRCELALAGCSTGIVLVLGAVLSVFVRGLALAANGSVMGRTGALGGLDRTLHPMIGWQPAVGAVLALFGALLLGTTFLGLRTTGPIRDRARRLTVVLAFLGIGAAAIAGLALGITGAGTVPVLITAAALSVCAGLLLAARSGKEVTAFVAAVIGVAAAVVAVFTCHLGSHDSVLLVSTLDPTWSLTVTGAAASGSSLRLISGAGVIILPGVLVYQAFSYWVFRHRVTSERLS